MTTGVDMIATSYASALPQDALFLPLKTKCRVTADLMEWVKSMPATYEEWTPSRGKTFMQKRVPESIVKRDPILSHFHEHLGPKGALTVLWMTPHTHYEMHVDYHRECGINFLLNYDDGSDSVSYFETGPFIPGVVTRAHHFCELQYEQDTFYAFNTHVRHAVMNGANNRYVGTIAMPCDYAALVAHIKKNNL